jgi:hypothetical protein
LREAFNEGQAILSLEEMKVIFQNIEEVLGVHQKLLKEMEERRNQWPKSQCIGDLLLKVPLPLSLHLHFSTHLKNRPNSSLLTLHI